MRTEFSCPVCGEDAWREADEHRYQAEEHADPEAALIPYERLRRRVLFEVWFPGAPEVRASSRWCGRCGFATYSPRPEDGDLAAKYRFLQREEGDIGGSSGLAGAAGLDRRRAQRSYKAVMRHAAHERPRVLDFGGGDGKLLAPFIEAGAECALVDYNVRPLPGIVKLGDTLEDVPPERRFDVILCSHVLEHLADPAAVVRALAGRLEPSGVLFAEVPLEIWCGLPIARDPVTHVNFFTLQSLEELLIRNGLGILEGRAGPGSYAELQKDVAVVVAAPAPRGDRRPRAGAAATARVMAPSRRMRLARRLRGRLRRARRQNG